MLSPMELLLLVDIAGVGKKNDLVVVRDGFALNCLLPERKALVATPTVRKRYAEQIKRRAEENEHDRKLQQEAVQVLTGKTLNLRKKASKTGKLYAGISAADIAAAFADQLGANVPESAIELSEHIKSVGAHTVTIKIGSASMTVPVRVDAEEAAKK